MALKTGDIDIEMTEENVAVIAKEKACEKRQGQVKPISTKEILLQSRLKSHQKKITYPEQIKLQLGSMEINFLLSAHERVISSFKSNKRFIEKELS